MMRSVEASLKGRLLVAQPHLVDPNFWRTVVLVLEHNETDGAAGVILNRPAEASLSDALPPFAPLAARPAVVFEGGPVATGAAVCLARSRLGAAPEGWSPVVGPLGVVDLSGEPVVVGEGIDSLRVFAGYAGWSPGQLEAEVAEDAWFVLEADPDDALAPVPESLWSFVLRRQGGVMSWVANFPMDPRMN